MREARRTVRPGQATGLQCDPAGRASITRMPDDEADWLAEYARDARLDIIMASRDMGSRRDTY